MWGHDIAVDWADPLPEVDDEIMSKASNFGKLFENIFENFDLFTLT